MAVKKVGTLIKEARTNADLTQEQLARRISGLTASDISLAERGKKDLTQAQLKQIAKITGVTQASLLTAAKSAAPKKSSTNKTSAKVSATTKTSITVTATEKKLVELYRAADTDTRKAAIKLLKGEENIAEDFLENLLDTVQDMLGGK